MSQRPDQAPRQPDDQLTSNKIKTIVYATIENSAVSYTLIPDDNQAAKRFKDGHIWLKKDSGEHDIHFRIVDGTDSGLTFDGDAIWVQENGTCPPAKGSTSKQVSCPPGQNGPELKITDRNEGDPVRLCYQLNIVDKNGVPHPFDPIIINDGGIWSPPPFQ